MLPFKVIASHSSVCTSWAHVALGTDGTCPGEPLGTGFIIILEGDREESGSDSFVNTTHYGLGRVI